MSSKSIMATMFIVVACGSLLVDLKAVQAQEVPDACTVCMALAMAAQNALNPDATEDQVLDTMEQQCDRFPVIKTLCLAAVDDAGSDIVAMLAQNNDPGLACHSTGLC